MTSQCRKFLDSDSEAGSLNEEERIRCLFKACDSDGDGYINSDDLEIVCRELRLGTTVTQLQRELGADEMGRISFDGFMRSCQALRTQIDALHAAPQTTSANGAISQCHPTSVIGGSLDYLTTSSGNSLGASGKQESWEFDSGARDLSPEPHTLHKLIEAAGGSLTGNTSNLLELANKLHLAALNSLKKEILNVSSQLQNVTHERDLLKKNIQSMQIEKLKVLRENELHQETSAQHYEEQITELHGVIAELSKKLEAQRSYCIQEEDEEEEELEEEELPEDDMKDCFSDLNEQGEVSMENKTNGEVQIEEDVKVNVKTKVTLCDAATMCDPLWHSDEIELLSDRNILLQVQLTQKEKECLHLKGTLNNVVAERGKLRRKIRELQLILQQVGLTSAEDSRHIALPVSGDNLPAVPKDDAVVCKVAEKVKLRKVDTGERHVTGSDIKNVSTTKVAEQLVQSLHEESDMQELCHMIATGNTSGFSVTEAKIHELELDVELLQHRVKLLHADKDVLSLTLSESRALSDNVVLLLGQYESNNVALNLAVQYGDQIIEAYDILVALLESELGMLLANCRAAGIGKDNVNLDEGCRVAGDDITALLKKAADNKSVAETVAQHMLSKVECLGDDIDTSQGEDAVRELIVKLKDDRAVVRSTLLNLVAPSSIYPDPEETTKPLPPSEAKRLDLETAVLIQELNALREERADIRVKLTSLQKQKYNLNIRVNYYDRREASFQNHIDELLNESQSLSSILSKEKSLSMKPHISRLNTVIAKITANFSKKQDNIDFGAVGGENKQLGETERLNRDLVQELELCRAKYQAQIQVLEQQLLASTEKHPTCEPAASQNEKDEQQLQQKCGASLKQKWDLNVSNYWEKLNLYQSNVLEMWDELKVLANVVNSRVEYATIKDHVSCLIDIIEKMQEDIHKDEGSGSESANENCNSLSILKQRNRTLIQALEKEQRSKKKFQTKVQHLEQQLAMLSEKPAEKKSNVPKKLNAIDEEPKDSRRRQKLRPSRHHRGPIVMASSETSL